MTFLREKLNFLFNIVFTYCCFTIRAASSEFGTYRICEQRRFRRACASAQSHQNLRSSLIQAVSQEEPSDRKTDPWPLWMAGHAQLKFVMTECSKTQIHLTRPIKKKLCKEWRPLHIPDQIPLHRFIHFWTDFTTALYRDWNVGDLTYDCLQPLSAKAWLEHVKDTRSSDPLIRSQTRSRLPRKEGKYSY